MKAAITELEIALQTMETNEPINRNEGKTEQADLEAKNAADFRQALAVLRAADGARCAVSHWIPLPEPPSGDDKRQSDPSSATRRKGGVD
jgi:hypothetical protein